MTLLRFARLAAVLVALGSTSAARADAGALDRLIDAYYAEVPKHYPTAATELGIHDHDRNLEDFSKASRAREQAWLKKWRERFAAVDAKPLDRAHAADLKLVLASLDASLLEWERVQRWRHGADFYPGHATNSIYVIIKRDFAPLDERLRSVIAREEKIVRLLADGQKNLTVVPRVSVDIALEQMPGTIAFFRADVPEVFRSTPNRALKANFVRANEAVIRALKEYERFLIERVKPKTVTEFALGEELFRAKLKADQLIETPLPELLARGEAEISRLQTEFKKTAARIDPKRTYVEVQTQMYKDHPTSAQVIPEVKSRLDGIRRFLIEKNIVTVPSDVMPRVEETPPFLRATTFASMSTPGPFEKHATEAYYNVTLPDPKWPVAKSEDYLGSVFNRPLIDIVTIHETFPGHYVQFLWLPKVTSKVRKFESVSSNAEGWAHYCEQMLLDEGYGAGDDKLRLAQLQDALLRAARYIVGIRMHTRGMTFEEGVAYFQREGLQSADVALMETKRGTKDPTYLVYTLGKLEILRLRDDYKQKLGKEYTLKKFHDAFLAEGAPPLSIVRAALLESP